jgi:hypothetical protein
MTPVIPRMVRPNLTQQVETTLRDLAYVFHLTKQVKKSLPRAPFQRPDTRPRSVA